MHEFPDARIANLIQDGRCEQATLSRSDLTELGAAHFKGFDRRLNENPGKRRKCVRSIVCDRSWRLSINGMLLPMAALTSRWGLDLVLC